MKVSAAELARLLGVSAARVSQYVKEKKLDGCFTGDGRARRFDFEASVAALRARLDPDQVLANGRRTQARIDLLAVSSGFSVPHVDQGRDAFQHLEDLRQQKVIEDLRARQIQNQREEQRWVYAPAVEGAVQEILAAERQEMVAFLRGLPPIFAHEMGLQEQVCEEAFALAFADFLKRAEERKRDGSETGIGSDHGAGRGSAEG